MSFHWPHLFWLLLIPGAFLAWEVGRRRTREAAKSSKVLRAEVGASRVTLTGNTTGTRRPRWRLALGLAFLVVALTRPQWGRIEEPVYEHAREILIAVDLSRSMLAEDVKPTRLNRARLLVTSLLERLKGERVGLVVFAGTAFLQSPLSADYEILRDFLPELSPDFLPQGGTDFKALLDTAANAFSTDAAADRFLVVLSDGEDLQDSWRDTLKTLQERSIHVITLGIGTAAGSMIPDGKGGLIKDQRGAVVLSKLKPETLQELARATGGTYVDASNWVDLAQVINRTVEQGRQGAFTEKSRVRLMERFQWALGPGLLFLLWSIWREFPVCPRARKLPLKTAAAVAAKTTIATLIVTAFALSAPRLVAQAAAETTAGDPLAEPLSTLVGQLSGKPALAAKDYADIASTTITYGERSKESQKSIPDGAIDDALAAVDAGSKLDPKAADWNKLASELNALKPPPPQDQPKPQDQQNQDQQSGKDGQKSDSNQQKQDPQKNDSSDPQNQSDPNKSGDSQSGQQNQDSQKSDSQKQDAQSGQDQPPKDAQKQQSAFGDMKEPDKEPQAHQQPAEPSQPENRDEGETQKVGGAKQGNGSPGKIDPNLMVPLQKLEQVREGDSPVRLQMLLQGQSDEENARKGQDW